MSARPTNLPAARPHAFNIPGLSASQSAIAIIEDRCTDSRWRQLHGEMVTKIADSAFEHGQRARVDALKLKGCTGGNTRV
jgi:hypothetical protein